MHELVGVFVPGDDRNRFVLAVVVQVADILVFVTGGRGRELGTVEQRFVSVLVAVEQRIEGERIARVVAVHRGIGRRADRDRSVGTVSQQDHRGGQQQRVPHHAAAAVGVPHAPPEQGEERQCEEGDARVDRQAERVDEQRVDLRPDPDGVGDDDVVDEDDHRPGHERREGDASPGHRGGLAEVVDEDQRGDAEQVEDVYADREAHQVGDQHDPARGVGFVGLLLPFEHQPHDQRREHRREGVDLALVGREPEGVGEGVIRADINMEIVATLLTFQFELLKKSDQIFNSKYTFTEIFETIFKSFIRGIATPEGVKYTDEFFEENR